AAAAARGSRRSTSGCDRSRVNWKLSRWRQGYGSESSVDHRRHGGLGETISTKMAGAGYRVVVTCSPSKKTADEWLARMKGNGYDFRAYSVDVSDFDSCCGCVQQVTDEIAPVDILVNNAGITRDMTFKKMTKADWDLVLRT